ncbi:DoxX family protein [Poritiphilus flavus]|uniref:DoxX family membrane protein n=1 Tax=Poritiphilus flavus TaxID=2697053 RepID=A0A6L9EEX2_9FLAO|nr:DoxX family protein [Poritiphilus flavus]NAS13122.1 DoxX family membrane protein [Poritiphilus flavus]
MTSNFKNSLGLALLRVLSSVMLLTHGIPKVKKLLNGNFEFADPIGIGATPSLFLTTLAEFVCPILIIIGFKTRWAAIPPAISMFVAAFFFHSADPFGAKEKPLLFLLIFLVLVLTGPGKFSIDRK